MVSTRRRPPDCKRSSSMIYWMVQTSLTLIPLSKTVSFWCIGCCWFCLLLSHLSSLESTTRLTSSDDCITRRRIDNQTRESFGSADRPNERSLYISLYRSILNSRMMQLLTLCLGLITSHAFFMNICQRAKKAEEGGGGQVLPLLFPIRHIKSFLEFFALNSMQRWIQSNQSPSDWLRVWVTLGIAIMIMRMNVRNMQEVLKEKRNKEERKCRLFLSDMHAVGVFEMLHPIPCLESLKRISLRIKRGEWHGIRLAWSLDDISWLCIRRILPRIFLFFFFPFWDLHGIPFLDLNDDPGDSGPHSSVSWET